MNYTQCVMLLFASSIVLGTQEDAQHNVIHVIIDDLRPELGCYGLPHRHTPVIDKIAASGTVFDRAYAQQAVCGPRY